ncbi:MAG: hypothetical protein CMK85_12640 [Pseudomonadales bacterium]|nr:hypothetical protein [Pseudomonadales bacterium]
MSQTEPAPAPAAPSAEVPAQPAPETPRPLNPKAPYRPPQDEPPADWLDGPPPDDSGVDRDDEDDLDASQYIADWQPESTDEAAVDEPGDELSDLPPASGLAAEWLGLFDQLGLSGLTQSIAAHCQLVARDGGHWTLHLDPGHSALYNENHRKRLEQAIAAVTQADVALTVDVSAPTQETPAVAAARRKAARQKAAELSIHNDPMVQRLCAEFSAEICADTIRPIDEPAS